MLLAPDRRGLARIIGQPLDVRSMLDPEVMSMIARRKALYLREQGIVRPPREYEMPGHPVPPNRQLGEGHAVLKGDAGLFGQDDDRPGSLDHGQEGVEYGAHLLGLARKMAFQIVPTAGMALIAVGEGSAAVPTSPQWPLGASCHPILLVEG
jgi:hypothetical protein